MSAELDAAAIQAELIAVVVTVDENPRVLASGTPLHLPAGALRNDHNSLQSGVRAFAEDQTGQRLGFVEQLYTFADLDRSDAGQRTISISYLGLTRPSDGDGWQDIYQLLPWEDRRDPAAISLCDKLIAELRRWCGVNSDDGSDHASDDGSDHASDDGGHADARRERVDHLFAQTDHPWRPELALQRYELLWEAGLVRESPRATAESAASTGAAMHQDHRRILATALSRLRSTLQYRPVVFELMSPTFTLGELQSVVESLVGTTMHKQNFRRSVEHQQQLVQPTDQMSHDTGGRPARLYRFRGDVIAERLQAGTKVPLPRSR